MEYSLQMTNVKLSYTSRKFLSSSSCNCLTALREKIFSAGWIVHLFPFMVIATTPVGAKRRNELVPSFAADADVTAYMTVRYPVLGFPEQ